MKQAIKTDSAPVATGPFSQAILVDKMIYVGGQIYLKPDGTLLEGDIEGKTHQVMQNLKAILDAAGANFSHVVKTTIYVTDMKNYPKVSEVYGGYLSAPYPARETVCVKELPLGAEVEISMIAILS
ncbi:MAG: Rid family detoxifying hydrolase [Microgenomates group bacterium]